MDGSNPEPSEEEPVPAEAEADEIPIESEEKPRSRPSLPREPSFSRWCADDGTELPACPPEGSSDSSVAEEYENFELPLLQPDESERGAAERSDYFRQRSTALALDARPNGKRFATFDVENGVGLHASASRLKLDLLEQASHSPLSAGSVLRTLFYILVWYTFSTCLTLYNKKLLGNKLGKFPAPLLMNTLHFGLQAILSKMIICFQCRGSEGSITMTWKDYFIRVVPTALGTALDINLSNASLVFISVTFATMCKSASPIFLLLFAFAFRLENPSIKLLGIILIISAGVLLTVAKETEFELWGFVFVMLAAVMSGFRWSMTQILLQLLFPCMWPAPDMKKEAYGLKDPITLMSYVTPVMAIATAILSLAMDPWHEIKKNSYFDNSWHVFRSGLLMLMGGALAFFMVLTEYILVSATSAVTVTIAGVVKEAVTIVVAVFYFHDDFTLLKGIGLVTIMVGVGLFNWYKYRKLRKGEPTENKEISPISDGSTKYVILDDLDFQDDET